MLQRIRRLFPDERRGPAQVVGGLLACCAMAAAAAASSPSLSIITPRGVQRGTEAVLTFNGGNLADAQEILFYSEGFEVLKLEPSAGAVKVTLRVLNHCREGEHVAQVRTATGISEFRTFFVGPFPSVEEKEPNSDFANPQPVPMNVTIAGVVESEDVDYFVVEARKGERISAEVEGMRLGVTMFDPYLAILDAKRFELSAADDTPLVKQDAVASIVAPEDGRYIIQIRESAYGGNGSCLYRLHVGSFPRPTAVYPAGGKLGEELEVQYLGDPSGPIIRKLRLPEKPNPNFGLLPEENGVPAPSEIPFRLFEQGNVLEAEPNNALAQATPAELPLAFNGILQTANDVDFFKFTAKQNQVWEVECLGRRIRSAVDPVMVLYNAAGQALVANDDARGPDAYFRFSVPADGDYALSITDHLGRGGPEFVYRVEFTPVKPALTVGIPRVERYSQYRQQIYVPKGGRFATLMTVSRDNFGGDVVLAPAELPQGITMVAEPMPANQSVMPVVFEAAADAPLSGKLVDFRARHADPNQNISGGFFNRADFVISAPGQSLFSYCDVNRLAVAVVEALPFSIEIVEPKVPVVQNGSMQLKILARKQAGWDEPITVQVPYLPPGVGGVPSVEIPKGQTEVLFPINASSGAEVRKWRIYALGSANVGGTAWASSQLAALEVAPPVVQFAMQRAAVEQGQQTELVCNVAVARPFEGTAKVQLLGLPPKVTAPEGELTKDSKELVFKLATDKTSPPGTHKNIFCQVIVIENGEPMLHYVGGTELRIDQPLPAPAQPPSQPAAAAAAAPAEKPPEPKRLTRLEKLRLEAKEKAEAAAKK